MASAAANSALGTEVLAVQRLYYNINPNAAASIFLLFSSQLLGYGIGGMMRRTYLSRHLTGDLNLLHPRSRSPVPVQNVISSDTSPSHHVRCFVRRRAGVKEKTEDVLLRIQRVSLWVPSMHF